MADRRVPYAYQNNALRPTGQWSDGGQMTAQYSSASAQYSQASYNTSTHHHGVPGQPTSGSMYAAPPMHQGAMQGNYHSGASSYPPDAGRLTSAAMSQQAYSSPSQAYPEQQAYSSSQIPRQQHSHPHHHHHHSQPYPIPQPMGPPPMMGHVDPAGQYPSQMAYRQATPLSSQHPDYPASPSRPFCCDLCALSFNRMRKQRQVCFALTVA